MDTADLIRQNLLSPIVLAFALGLFATLLKSDLRFPEPIYSALSTYLLLAIGLKGGAALATTAFADVGIPAAATVALGILTTLLAYAGLRGLGRFDRANSAAIAAHYGSVSAVTFMAAQAFVKSAQIEVEGFMPALVALLEIPAIIVALLMAARGKGGGSLKEGLHEVLTGKSIVLLAGGLIIGWAAGPHGLDSVKPVFVTAFPGILLVFLLEMGTIAAKRLGDVAKAGPFLIAFAIGMPIVNGALGVACGTWVGLSLGGATVLGAMAASASYIAAPAAVRLAIPEANPSLYLTSSIAITFPFNITLGLPLYYAMARLMQGG